MQTVFAPVQHRYRRSHSKGRSKVSLSGLAALGFTMILGLPGQAIADFVSDDPLLYREGMAIYTQHCARCHGQKGDGRGPVADELETRPRDFQHDSFKFRSTGMGAPPSQKDLLNVIANGIEGSYGEAMPSFSFLTRRQQRAVVEAVRGFAGLQTLGKRVRPPKPPASFDLARGEALYRQFQCSDCHGVDGDGKGVLLSELQDEDGAPIRAADFTTGKFKGGNSPKDIWHRIYGGVGGTPMPSFGSSISEDELWEIVNYVLAFSGKGVR
ncbi:MAG: c-type cytochrome [Pseudomonadota bacterium]